MVIIICRNCETEAEMPNRWYKFCSEECSKEKSRERARNWKKRNIEKNRNITKEWRKQNKEHIQEYTNSWYLDNKHKEEYRARHNRNRKNRMKNDPKFKMASVYRSRTKKFYNGTLRSFDLLDCTIDILLSWLMFLDPELNFEDHGYYGWHLDHVIPVSLFDMLDMEQVQMCFHWSNLQPLDGRLNNIKNNNITIEEVEEHENKVRRFCYENNLDYPNWDKIKFITELLSTKP